VRQHLPPPPPLDSPPKTADIAWALRIIGGREADPGRWPWQIVILNKYREAFCGGTLIHPRWVLTASHCVRKHLIVRVGEHDLVIHEGSETEYIVRRTIVHPDYNRDTVDNDVALLELPEAVQLGRHAGLACLPDQQEALPDQEHCTIIGWGKEKKSHFFGTEVLHEARVGRHCFVDIVFFYFILRICTTTKTPLMYSFSGNSAASAQFHSQVFVSDLFSPRIGLHISSSRIGRPMVEIYKSLTDA
jgi:hypothetical protein